MIKFKNPKLNELVQSISEYGNLILNDVELNGEGQVMTKKEKPRSDEKVSRQYYNAAFMSLDNTNAARVVTMWQSHTKNGEGVIWKNAFNPIVAAKLLGNETVGKVCIVKFNQEYSVGMNLSNKATLFIPHDDVREEIIEKFAIDNGMIIEKDNGIINDGDDTLEDEKTENQSSTEEKNEEHELVGEKPEGKEKPKGKKDPAVTGTN